jgi:cobalt-precorrin-5B (C1)-methyltransferase
MMVETIIEAARIGVGADATSVPDSGGETRQTYAQRPAGDRWRPFHSRHDRITPFLRRLMTHPSRRRCNAQRRRMSPAFRLDPEAAVKRYDLPETALIEMGVSSAAFETSSHASAAKSTIGGASPNDQAQGRLDLHSGRLSIDLARLAQTAREVGAGEGTRAHRQCE